MVLSFSITSAAGAASAVAENAPSVPAGSGVPLTLRTVGPAYADYVLEVVDTDTDRKVTYVEWINAGGSKRSFELVDQNRDGVVTRTELIRFGSNTRFLDTTRRYVDFNKDNKLTPRDFRSPAGVRMLRFEF